MKFSELVRLLEEHGFRILKEKGSIRYYGKDGWDKLIRLDYHGSKEGSERHLSRDIEICGHKRKKFRGERIMIELKYSLIIEATEEPDFFGFYSPDLEGFTGIGHSIEDCIYQAKWGMIEHIELLKEIGLPIPPKNPNPKIIVQNQQNLV